MKRQVIVSTILDNINTLKRGFYGRMHASWGNLGLSHSQVELFFAIKHLQPVSSKQLASQLYLTPGAISQIVDYLVEHDLVERHIDPKDRRKQYLQLTAIGEQQYRSIERARQDILSKILEEISDDDLENWMRIQLKIIDQVAFKSPKTKE